MPDCQIFQAPNLIDWLATAIIEYGHFEQSLRNEARRSSLTIYAIVAPGTMKGQPNPILKRRASLVVQEVGDT